MSRRINFSSCKKPILIPHAQQQKKSHRNTKTETSIWQSEWDGESASDLRTFYCGDFKFLIMWHRNETKALLVTFLCDAVRTYYEAWRANWISFTSQGMLLWLISGSTLTLQTWHFTLHILRLRLYFLRNKNNKKKVVLRIHFGRRLAGEFKMPFCMRYCHDWRFELEKLSSLALHSSHRTRVSRDVIDVIRRLVFHFLHEIISRWWNEIALFTYFWIN